MLFFLIQPYVTQLQASLLFMLRTPNVTSTMISYNIQYIAVLSSFQMPYHASSQLNTSSV